MAPDQSWDINTVRNKAFWQLKQYCCTSGTYLAGRMTTFHKNTNNKKFFHNLKFSHFTRCLKCLTIKIDTLLFSSAVITSSGVYMRWPLFLPPPHPIPSLTSLSLNEILSLFCPDPAEFVLMGGNLAPLEAGKET